MQATIRYADGGPSLGVRLIATWDRGGIPAPVMSASSGPKDYIKNRIFELFEAHPRINRVVMVRASGPAFLLMRDEDNCWFDMSGKQVVAEEQQMEGTA